MTTPARTITIIVSYAYPFIGSGIGNVAVNQAEHLAKKGHVVTLISSNIPRTDEIFTRNRVRYFKVPALNILYRLHVPVPLFLFPRQVRQVLATSDVIHVHDVLYPSSFLAAWYAKRYGKPLIVTQHIPLIVYRNPLFNWLQRLAFATIGRYILSASSRILYFNSEVGQWLRDYKNKLVFLPNGVATSFFRPAASPAAIRTLKKKYQLPLTMPLVLFVGRLVPKKGYDLLYAAADTRYCVLFVGSGTVPEAMRHHPQARFLGAKPPAAMRELYQLADVFVLPSQGEGFPLSVQEAMATGLPVVVSRLGCYADMKLDPVGVAQIEPTVAQIRNTILKILTDPRRKKAMQQYSRSIVTKAYRWDTQATALATIYEEAIAHAS